MNIKDALYRNFDLALVEAEQKSGMPPGDWFWSGPMKPDTAVNWWFNNGPGLCQNFADWYEASGAKVWRTPLGDPAVELMFDVMFEDIRVRGAIDCVVYFGDPRWSDNLVIVDWKTSSRKPESNLQLGIYAGALELEYGIRPKYGTFFMVRGTGPRGCPPEERTYFQPPVSLESREYSVSYIASELRQFDKAVQEGIFPANVTESCARCGVARACFAVGGTSAVLYDPSHPDYEGKRDGRP